MEKQEDDEASPPAAKRGAEGRGRGGAGRRQRQQTYNRRADGEEIEEDSSELDSENEEAGAELPAHGCWTRNDAFRADERERLGHAHTTARTPIPQKPPSMCCALNGLIKTL
eukprot:5204653-Pleurochrysis_carterae.AAC.1